MNWLNRNKEKKRLEEEKMKLEKIKLDERIALEYELSDLFDTALTSVEAGSYHQYEAIHYSIFIPLFNGKTGDTYMAPRRDYGFGSCPIIPPFILPEKVCSKESGNTLESTLYIPKENIRIFGFDNQTFRELIKKMGCGKKNHDIQMHEIHSCIYHPKNYRIDYNKFHVQVYDLDFTSRSMSESEKYVKHTILKKDFAET